MADTSQGSKTVIEIAGERLVWRAWPFGERRGRGLAALGAVLILALGLGAGMKSWGWSAFAVAVLFLSLESFYFPTTFQFTNEGAEARRLFHRSSRSWGTVRRVVEDPAGLYLCPFVRSGRFQTFRAFRVYWGEGDREGIRGWARARLGGEVEWTVVS